MSLLPKFLKKPTASPGIVAVNPMSAGFAVAVAHYADQLRPRLLRCEFVSASPQQFTAKLETLVKSQRLENYHCHLLLAPEQYRSVSIESPPVSSEEIKQAVLWRVADFLDYPVGEATIDFFPQPPSNRANSTPMLEVFAAQSQLLTELSQSCRQAGLDVKVIDIQETALRNIGTLLPENDQGVALLHLQSNSGHLVIQKSGSIYLARKITSGYSQLADDPLGDTEALHRELDNLALEIQRSFDYVENYFGIPPITSLAVVLMPIDTQNIINYLTIQHGITTRVLDLSAIIDCDNILNDNLQNLCAPAIGASLRRLLETAPK